MGSGWVATHRHGGNIFVCVTDTVVIEKGLARCREKVASHAGGSTSAGGGDDAPAAGRYPSTPHLPFSPTVRPPAASWFVSQADCHRPCLVWRLQVHDDDVLLPACGASRFVGPRVIITEKLDGANCCLQRGEVYARTHSHAATHASFGPGV